MEVREDECMWIANKALNKMAHIVLRNDVVYEKIQSLVAVQAPKLPEMDDAFAILEAASPRPKGGLSVSPREWPECPQVDVSVIVPCYNVERYLKKCLESIIGQRTSYSYEVICVDDGSTDSTGRLLDEFAENNEAIRVIHQKNRGLSGARNSGMVAARGATFMFVDSDDIVLPGAIENLYKSFDEQDVDYITATYERLSENGEKKEPLGMKRAHGAPWGRLYSREVWRNLEFPEGFWFEDTVQLFCIDSRFRESYLDVPVYLYRYNGDGIMSRSRSSKKSLDTLWIVDEMCKWCNELHISKDVKFYDKVLWQLGPLLWERTVGLTAKEHLAMFRYASDLLEHCNPGHRFKITEQSRWLDVERGLESRNYKIWKTAVLGLPA